MVEWRMLLRKAPICGGSPRKGARSAADSDWRRGAASSPDPALGGMRSLATAPSPRIASVAEAAA